MDVNPNAQFRDDLHTYVEDAPGRNEGLVGMELLPIQTVKTRTGHYPRLSRLETGLFEANAAPRAPHGDFAETTREYIEKEYSTQEWGLSEKIDDVHRADLDRFFDLEVIAARETDAAVRRRHEINVGKLLTKTGDPEHKTAPAFHKIEVKTPWTEQNIADFDVIADIERVLAHQEGQGYLTSNKQLTMVIASDLWRRVKRSKKLSDSLFPANNDGKIKLVTTSMIIDHCDGLKEIKRPKGRYNASKNPKQLSLQPMWPERYIFFGYIAGGEVKNGGVGRTLNWDMGNSTQEGFTKQQSWRVEPRTNYVLSANYHGLHIVDFLAGVVLDTLPEQAPAPEE
jgi:hypothetical protein